MKYGIPSKKGYEINYKRYFLASKIGNKSIINNIMRGFKTMLNKILKPSNIIKGYKIINRIKWVIAKIFNKLENVLMWIGYNWVGYKVDIIALEGEIKELKKINDNSFKLIEKDIKALELAVTMAKNDHNNLQDSFNKYVLRPKAKEVLKDCEDYSYEERSK